MSLLLLRGAMLVSAVLAAHSGASEPCADTTRLACTGLYQTNSPARALSPGVRAFTPGYRLWSDGLEKSRYIQLPARSRIDTSDADDWIFPVGTRVWKEFRWKGRRVETRFMQKLAPGEWRRTTFVWNDAGTDAIEDRAGKTITLAGSHQPYDIPAANDCGRCHDGRRDSVLGFDTVALAAPEAQGMTLARLDAEHMLSQPIDPNRARVGGGRVTAAALGWLHINCGVSCHNASPAASASFLGLDLKLAAAVLAEPADAAVFRTAINRPTMSLGFRDPRAPRLRIVPGHPEASAIYVRAASRAPVLAMPPLASHVVDAGSVALLRRWISSLRPLGTTKASAP